MTTTLLMTLSHRDHDLDLEIRVDGPALVSDLVDTLIHRAVLDRPPPVPSLAVERTGETLVRSTRLTDADLRSGDRCQLADAPLERDDVQLAAAAVAEIVEGAGAGHLFELRPGPSDIGRKEACDIKIDDPLISRRHARVNVQ